MKKIITLIITICIFITTTYAYNLTKIINGHRQTTTMNEGQSITLIYTDKTGYTFTSWSATGITLANPTSKIISITMPGNDVTLTLNTTTAVTKYTLTTIINGITETLQKAPGESITLTAVPQSGYTFSSWTTNGITLQNTATVTFTMPSNNVTIQANFVESHTHSYSEATCTVAPTCSCGATNGSALGHDFNGTRTCNVNGSTDQVKCSRCNETESQTCTHTYIITATQTSNGTITLSSTSVKAGGSATATITPSSGYEVSSVTVNGVNKGAITSYSFSNVTSNQTVSATYNKKAIIANNNVAIGAYIAYMPSSTSYKVYETDTGDYNEDGDTADYQEFNPSQTTLWRVMYNNNGQLDIVSADSVGDLSLYGATGYAKAVDTLNNLGNAYVNTTYATSGRHIGSTSESVGTINTTTYPLTVENTYSQDNIGLPYHDTLYEIDVNQLKNNNMLHSSGYTWLASRNFYRGTGESCFRIYCIHANGNVIESNYLYVVETPVWGGDVSSQAKSYGVRPVVSLKSEIRITGGSGTSADPYTISK